MNRPSRTLSVIGLILLSIVVVITLVLLNNVRFDDSLRAMFNRDHGIYDQAMAERSQDYLLEVLPLIKQLEAGEGKVEAVREEALAKIDLAYAYMNVGRYLERYECTSKTLSQLLNIRSNIETGTIHPFMYDEWAQILNCYSVVNRHQAELKANLIERTLIASQNNQFWMNVGVILVYVLGIMLWLLLERQHRHSHRSEAEKTAWQNRAMTDHLTSTLNRMALHESLDELVNRWPQAHDSVALVFYDIDHFKQFNDTFGHVAGDDALREVTKAVNQLLPKNTEHFRFGGEEFFIVCHGQSHPEAISLADQMLEAVHGLNIRNPNGLNGMLTISIGVYMLEHREYTADELIKKVDELLYVAKKHGRNRVVDEFVGGDEA